MGNGSGFTAVNGGGYDAFLDGLMDGGDYAVSAGSKRSVKKIDGYYIYHSENGACDACTSLDRQVFSYEEMEEGENYPPIHPNCRCSVVKVLKDDSIKVYELDGEKVWVNLKTLIGIGELPSGEVLIGEQTDEWERIIYKLVKEREQPGADVNAIGNQLYLIAKELADEINFESKQGFTAEQNKQNYINRLVTRTMEYYQIPDVTKRVNGLMVRSEYVNSSNTKYSWVFTFLETFPEQVKNGSSGDWKNLNEFKQNSIYIYNHEIVSRDALGNIGYGYLGKAFNIPDEVLFLGAGIAQISAGTSDIKYAYTLFDDPRDTVRVKQ